jgi:hypothetical protein
MLTGRLNANAKSGTVNSCKLVWSYIVIFKFEQETGCKKLRIGFSSHCPETLQTAQPVESANIKPGLPTRRSPVYGRHSSHTS